MFLYYVGPLSFPSSISGLFTYIVLQVIQVLNFIGCCEVTWRDNKVKWCLKQITCPDVMNLLPLTRKGLGRGLMLYPVLLNSESDPGPTLVWKALDRQMAWRSRRVAIELIRCDFISFSIAAPQVNWVLKVTQPTLTGRPASLGICRCI